MTTSTRLEIEEEVLRILAQRDPEASMVPIPMIGTISAVGTITSPGLDRGTISASRFDGRIIKVAEDATAVAFATPVTITGAHTAVITTLTVNSTAEIRSGDVLELNGAGGEKVLVRAVVSATSLTITRAHQGTTAVAYTGAETVLYDPFGQVTGVDDGGFAAGGVLTISPNFSVAGYGAGYFYLYPKGLHPDYVIEKMNAVLRSTDSPHIWFPSLVTDSDMESADLTNWDATTTPDTREFVTSAANVLWGSRSLHLISDAGEGAETEDFDVTEGEQLLVSINVRVVAGSLKVILRNVTAGSDTKALTTLNERVFTEVAYRQAVPDGCVAMALQFNGESTDSEYYISPHVIVQSNWRRAYAMPSWFTREGQFVDAVYFPQGQGSEVNESYIALSDRWRRDAEIEFLRSDRDANPMRVELQCPGHYPVALMLQRPFAELTYDTMTTVADKDFVALKTVSNILRDREDDGWKHFAARASERARTLRYGGRVLTSRPEDVYV